MNHEDNKMFVLMCESGEIHSFDGFYGKDGRKEAEQYSRLNIISMASCAPHFVGEVKIVDIKPVPVIKGKGKK